MKITMNSNFTFKRMLGGAVLMFIAIIQLQAAHLPSFTIINAGLGKQFGLKVQQPAGERSLFKVSTPQGETIMSQRISDMDYSALYSLERLDEGEYLFILITSANEIRQPIRLTKRAIFYQLSSRQVIHFPEVVQKGRQLDVNYTNPALESFTIKLLTKGGEIYYEETFSGLADIEKRLNLLKLPAGIYHLQMRTAQGQWNEEIQLR